MGSWYETCKTGMTAGSVVGGLTGFALDLWLSIAYVRPALNHLDTSDRTQEIITGVIALLAMPLFVTPGAWAGKIAGPPIAIALRCLYECGASSISALRSCSLYRHKTNQIQGDRESDPLLNPTASMV